MNVCNRRFQPVLVFNHPVTYSPVFARAVPIPMIPEPAFSGIFVSCHEQIAILLGPVKDEVDMIVHQAEADDLNRVIQTKVAETEGDPVDPGDKLDGRREQNVILQPFGGIVIIMRFFHIVQFCRAI